MPHGVSLILGIINLKFSDNKPKNLKCLFSKNSWKGSFEINQIKFTLNFNENVKRYKSKFYFKINNELILRPTKIINDKFYNFLSYKNKTIEISNPMDDCLKYHLNNIKNLKNFKSNKRFTYYAMELNNKFLVNSFQKL